VEYFSKDIARLVTELSRLPGVGVKSAQRLAFYIINSPLEQAEALSESILSAKKNIRYCRECFTITDSELCPVCASEERNHRQIMVVENPRDMGAYERTGRYHGVYHVLHGSLSPLSGIGPENLRVKELLHRLEGEAGKDVQEIIMATNPTVEGEATAMYLARLLKPAGLKVTRIAHGLPIGGDLEYADEVTLAKALENRKEI